MLYVLIFDDECKKICVWRKKLDNDFLLWVKVTLYVPSLLFYLLRLWSLLCVVDDGKLTLFQTVLISFICDPTLQQNYACI